MKTVIRILALSALLVAAMESLAMSAGGPIPWNPPEMSAGGPIPWNPPVK